MSPLARITEATRGVLAAVDIPAEWAVTVTYPARSPVGCDILALGRESGWLSIRDLAIVDTSEHVSEPEVTLRRAVGLDEARRTLAGCDYEAGLALRGSYL